MFIFGTHRSDDIVGTDGSDLIAAGRGADEIEAGGGNDIIFSGNGRDSIDGGDGRDLIFAGRGSDTIQAGAGSDLAFGGNGADLFVHVVADSDPWDEDYYDGGRGPDTLQLVLTQSEHEALRLTGEIDAFQNWLDTGAMGSFTFASLGLTVHDIERLVLTIVDTGNSAPAVSVLQAEMSEDDAPLDFDLLTGASDPDGDALMIQDLAAQVTTREGRILTQGTDYQLQNGVLGLTAAGIALFNDLAAGQTDQVTFAFSVSDGVDTTSNTFTLTVIGADDSASISGEAAGAVVEDAILSAVGMLTIQDPDAGQQAFVPQTDVAGQYGLFSISADGSWNFALANDSEVVQALDQDQTVMDRFTVMSVDGSASEIVEITITGAFDAPPNQAPVAIDDTFDGDEDTQFSGDVLANDSDPEDDALSVALVSGPTNGALTLNPDGTFDYVANANFNGEDSFTYRISDGELESEIATALLTIYSVNDDPTVGAALLLDAVEDGAVQSVDLLSGASDVDAGDGLSIANVSVLPAGIELDGTTLSVDPSDPAFQALNDEETFQTEITFDVIDGNGGSVTQNVTVTVEGVTDIPPPDVPVLSISSADQTGPDQTTAARITLIGQTSPGAIVELQSADGSQVFASALADLTGKVRLPDVSLDLGVTEFQAVARDPDTGLESTAGTASFERVDLPPDAPANPVLHWIEVALETIAGSGTTPDYASRALAMQSIAVQNVLAAADGDDGYLFSFDGSGANPGLAVGVAAHGVLSGLFAGQNAALDAALSDFLLSATGGAGPVDPASQALGSAAAENILSYRRDDGWDEDEIYIGREEDGQWRPTGPAYFNALNPQWADLDTFTLATQDQFRPDAPPSVLGDTIDGDAYDNDLERIRALGASDSTDRTADQTQIARFWADGTGTETPPGHWNRIAAQVSQAEGLSLSQSAELMLKLNLALADAGIAAWDTKYAYDFWRPVTLLKEGGTVDLTAIMADPSWAPLLPTPAHPEYVSGHSTYSGAAATVLTDAFGDAYAFSDTAQTTSGEITRSFGSFWDAANEGGESRIFGGIHFDFSNVTGLALGEDVASWVLQSFDPLNDLVAPTVVLTNLDPDAVNTSPVIDGIVTDNLSGTLNLRAVIDGITFGTVAVGAQGAFSFDVGPLADGAHSVRFLAQDAAGNTGGTIYEFVLATTPPGLTLDEGSISDTNTTLIQGARIAGTVTPATGVDLAALSVQIDGGPILPLTFDQFGTFDAELPLGPLAPGAHTITLRAVDTAGNETVENIDATLADRVPFRVLDLTPNDREGDVGATIHPFVQFNREVDLATLNSDSFYAVTAKGQKIAATITPLNDGTGAWMFFDDPLPGSTAIELIVDGDLIRSADGAALDGDTDGTPGGSLVQRFTTVALDGLETTTLSGRIVDPGADLYPMTPDDFTSGPGGVTDYANHSYANPIEGAEVYVLGRPDLAVLTDENGVFQLTGLPTGKVKIVVDGRTATNAPNDIYWPEMVVDVEVRPGQENTIMGGMGPLEAQLERQEDQAFFLPRVPTIALTAVPDDQSITIRPVSAAGTDLTPEQFELITLEMQPNSMIDGHGNPIANPELGLALVPSEMVIDMLPDGVPTPPIFLTIQGPDGGVFTEEAVLTIPNVMGLAPGEKSEFFSYDHQTGLLVINGVGTVSADGSYIRTDPGSGILQPGWNGPVAVSRILIDPQLPCPPGTTHENNIDDQGTPTPDFTDDVEQLSATERFIREKYGDLSDLSLLERVLLNNPATSFYRQAEARLAVDMEIMANAAYAGDPGPLGGQVDAGFWGIMGTKFLGDLAETTVEAASILMPLKFPADKLELFVMSKVIDGSRAAFDQAAPWDELTAEEVSTRARDVADNGIAGKFGPNDTEMTQPFADLSDQAEQDATRMVELQEKWNQQKQQLDQLADQVEHLRDTYGDILEDMKQGIPPLQSEIEQIVGPPGSDPLDSDILQTLRNIETITNQVTTTGTLYETIYEIYGILYDLNDDFDEVFGELPETISLSDLEVPPTQVNGEYEISYGPVQYVLLTNLDTGEEQRFTMKSGSTPLQPTSPGANYSIELFDPVSGFTGASTFVAPRPFVVNSLTNFERLPSVKPILNPANTGPIGPGGLTEAQAKIVGADFDAIDSLLPGTNITDRQALISGLGSSPGSVNLNGVTGRLTLDGTSEAVAIGGDGANGAGLRAYVATGDLGLAIIDVSESTQPVLLGQIDLPGFAEDVAVIDALDLVAVALGAGGLAVIDVRDPVRPILDAIYDTLTVTQVIALGDRLIVGQDGRIKLIDAASGVELASVGVGVGPTQQFEALAYEDGVIYALGDNGTLHAVTINGTTLANRGALDVAGDLLDLPDSPQIATADGVLWIGSVGDGSGGAVRGGMLTVDATNPDVLALIAGLDTSNTVQDFAGNSVAVNGSGFGVASHVRFDTGTNSESRLTVFDARDPMDTQNQVTEYRFDGATQDIAIAAGEAFVATGREGLQIVRFLGIDTQGTAPDIQVATLPEDLDDAIAGLQVLQGQTVRFDVATDDDIQVRSVEVLINGNVILSTVTYPWDLTVTLPTIAELGTDQIDVVFRATDTGGNTSTTAPVQIQMVEDVTPFEILDITPDEGASLLRGAVRSVTVTFSKSVEADTVNAETFTLIGPSGPITPASISVRDSGTQVQLTYPADAFDAGAFTLTIDADAVTDRAGTALAAADVTSSFDIQVVSGQTWIGVTDGTWNDPVNWASGRAPLPGDDVVLPVPDGVTATISAAAGDVNSVNVSGTGTFRVATRDAGTDLSTTTLSNTGNTLIDEGRVEVTAQTANGGDLTVSGTPGTANGQPVTFIGELSANGTLTNTGTLQATSGGRIELDTPVIENQGTILLSNALDDQRETTLQTTGALTELTGGGTVEFQRDAGAARTASFIGSVGTAEQGVIDETLRNVDNTVVGTGDFGAGFVLENTATGLFQARDGDALRITSGRIDNDGTMRADTGGSLTFDSEQFAFFGGIFANRLATFIDNRDGIIRADGGQVNFTDSTISGGVLEATNGGFFTMFGGGTGFPRLDGMTDTLTLQGQLIAASFIQTAGTIDNQGVLSTSLGQSFGTEIQIIENSMFTGGGQINLFSGDVDADDRVATITNDYAVIYDEDTGEPLVDEFGEVQVEYETQLTLADQRLTGSGRVGTVDDSFFGGQPLFSVTLEAGSEIDANQPGQALEFVNTEITVATGATTWASGGTLRIIDSDVFNFGNVEVQNGGELSMQFGDGTSLGGYFFNEGQVNVFNGSLFSEFTFFNRGDFNLISGQAELTFLEDDVANGGRTTVGTAQLTLRDGGSTFMDVRTGDAEVIVENSSSFAATLFDFEVGDRFHFTDLDDSGPLIATFAGSGNTGVLTLDDGSSTVNLNLVTSAGDFSGVAGADFALSSSGFGGVLLETSLDFIL